jgi:predicted phosphoadenosine phosphosulfate sulfurtransferase
MFKKTIDTDVLTLGRERTAHTFDRFDQVSVLFSGGKDSTVCLMLAIEEARRRGRLPLDVVFYDEEAQCPETIEYMDRVRQWPGISLRWFCLPVKHRNACSRRSPYWYPWAPEDREKWCRPLPATAITDFPGFKRIPIPDITPTIYPASLGMVGVIIGLRAQESLRRFRVVTKKRHENYISVADPKNCHVYLVKPVYDWTTEDVWTAPKKLGWDYNRAYDVMTNAGMPRHVQRVCPPYGEEPLQNLWMYSVCWPDLWDKMSQRVPGAATAARYCRSPLFGHGAIASRPEGQTWQKLIGLALEKWSPAIASQIAERLQDFIDIHNKDTGCAPIEDEVNATSGVGWKLLYQIALRGDLKNRKNRKLLTGTKAPVRA